MIEIQMDVILIGMVVCIIILGYSVNTRLTDIRAMARTQVKNGLSSLQADRSYMLTRRLASTSALLIVVQIVFFIFFTLIYSIKGTLVLLPLSFIFCIIILAAIGDIHYGSRYLSARRAGFATIARRINILNYILTLSYLLKDL